MDTFVHSFSFFTNVITEHYIYIWYSRFVIGRFASMNTNSYSKVFWPPAVGQYDLLCLISEIRWTSSKLNFIYLWCIGGLEYHLYFVLFCICFRKMIMKLWDVLLTLPEQSSSPLVAYPSGAIEFTPGFSWSLSCSILRFLNCVVDYCFFCFLLSIVVFVFLRLIAYKYPYDIFQFVLIKFKAY